ncbi:uncharacterized protein LOC119074051 isoform X1 [Bradysia coprophila]|uniref:uncharacterized protein LOC119074051 isoform X1 n=1 Tax=Bradysia coprophila TaxID=38358 RepID=UPI00187DB690|nr:uncharacterized protein LOC119074051 isoform X1 [Bradysia coprophila]
MSVILKIKILIFLISISYFLTILEGKTINSNINILTDHQNHSGHSIADQVEIIFPNLHESLPTKQQTRLKKDPKFLSEQVEVFSKKNQTYKSIPGQTDGEAVDGKPMKFVSSRPLFVYRNEARKKQQQQQQHYGNEIVYSDRDHSYPYPYPFSYYTSHGVFHYHPYGRY